MTSTRSTHGSSAATTKTAGGASGEVSGVPIVLDEVTKRFPDQPEPAVDRISLELPPGRTTVFVGPSGCGKTTTMRMINRLIEPTSGTITIDGRDNRSLDPDRLRRTIGYAIQASGLFPHMTVARNVATVPHLLRWKKDRIAERVDEMLALVGLDPDQYRDRYPAQLSGGQQQRVGVARALAADPPVLLMDEPFGAVDPITRATLQDELLRLQDELHKTIVFVTHDFNEAVKLGDRIAILGKGSEVLQYDTPSAILTNPVNDTVAKFIGDDAALKQLTLISVGELDLDDAPTAVESESPAELAARTRADEWCVVLDAARRPVRWFRAGELSSLRDLREGGTPATDHVTNDSSLQEALDKLLSTASAMTVVVDREGAYQGTIRIADIVDTLRRTRLAVERDHEHGTPHADDGDRS